MLIDGQPAREEAKNGLSVLLVCKPACQHPSCWHAAMLGCTPAAQTDQHASTQHVSVHQHAKAACLSVGACVYPSTQHPAPNPAVLEYTRGCWTCGHVPTLSIRRISMSPTVVVYCPAMSSGDAPAAGLHTGCSGRSRRCTFTCARLQALATRTVPLPFHCIALHCIALVGVVVMRTLHDCLQAALDAAGPVLLRVRTSRHWP